MDIFDHRQRTINPFRKDQVSLVMIDALRTRPLLLCRIQCFCSPNVECIILISS